MYACVANVSKLNGLIISVIGNSFMISIEIKIPINRIEFFKYCIWIFLKVLNFEYPYKYALSSIE